ncbi:ExbD/TolR family protein [Sphingomonas sp. URHD0057]|uniref:ExbD/TolR family protein n=1 Tax=Sphingomonas sp. URHD0057 TaxID=1380389 RepID=UPI00048AC773|nr:biopolymer transporter ExbD [Sphingomonas sp. URHD0057]
MRVASAVATPPPILDLNTTPLIDVMLVLLAMFVITIPIQTHAVKLDVPPPCPTCPYVRHVSNEIAIQSSGQILWNEGPVSQDQLRFVLRQSQRITPAPELHLRPAPDARYETVDEVLGVIKREHVRKFGFIGNEAYASY